MKTKDARYEKREIVWEDDGEHSARVIPVFRITRWRDSKGAAGITCTVLQYADSGGHGCAEFSFDTTSYGAKYEAEARRFLEALGAACDEVCPLAPKPEGA